MTDHIFDPFIQADSSSSRQHEGIGLGLSITKGLVELLGGTVGARAEPKGGSTFWFTAQFHKADSKIVEKFIAQCRDAGDSLHDPGKIAKLDGFKIFWSPPATHRGGL